MHLLILNPGGRRLRAAPRAAFGAILGLAMGVGSCAQRYSQPPAAGAAPAGAAAAGRGTSASDLVAAAFPVPIVVLRGDAAGLGRAHGERLGPVIRTLFAAYFGSYFQAAGARDRALAAAGGFEPFLRPEHRDELRALSAASGLDPREALLGQTFLDLSPMMTACSTVTLPASASADGVARFGRNLDFPGFDVADKSTILLVYKPDPDAGAADARNAFASVAWPGMLGVMSGMNEHGLTLANMEVVRQRRAPAAMPYSLLYRTVLERCRTVDEAVALLRATSRQTANNVMLMDASGRRAVVEITPESVVVRAADDRSSLVSTNHQRGTDDGNADARGFCWRYDLLHDATAGQFGLITTASVEGMLAAAAQGNMTLQSMVFEPANRVLYLAVGSNAPTHGYARLDLKPYFAR